jgi:hypothetical protein
VQWCPNAAARFAIKMVMDTFCKFTRKKRGNHYIRCNTKLLVESDCVFPGKLLKHGRNRLSVHAGQYLA